jgi:hypothetical protein
MNNKTYVKTPSGEIGYVDGYVTTSNAFVKAIVVVEGRLKEFNIEKLEVAELPDINVEQDFPEDLEA